MSEEQPYTTLLKRLQYLQGHVVGIVKMLCQSRSAPDIFIQLLAIEGSINKIIYQVFDEVLRKDIAARLNILQETATNPQTLAILQKIRKDFPGYTLKQLPEIHYQLQQLAR